jgi:hypothetical protein
MKIIEKSLTIIVFVAMILSLAPQTQAQPVFDSTPVVKNSIATATLPPPLLPIHHQNLPENSGASLQPQRPNTPYFYYYFDKPISLTPKANQFVIGVRKSRTNAPQSFTSNLSNLATVKQLSACQEITPHFDNLSPRPASRGLIV